MWRRYLDHEFSGASSGVVNLGANTLTITNANGTFAGVIQDSGAGGGLAITGGKEVLTGANTYTGSTVVTGATLELDGSINGTSSVTVIRAARCPVSAWSIRPPPRSIAAARCRRATRRTRSAR